jgi:hypothetical protein
MGTENAFQMTVYPKMTDCDPTILNALEPRRLLETQAQLHFCGLAKEEMQVFADPFESTAITLQCLTTPEHVDHLEFTVCRIQFPGLPCHRTI